MMSPSSISFSGEDALSEALAKRCVSHCLPDTEFFSMRPAQGGKNSVIAKLPNYVRSSIGYCVFVMLDLDTAPCPPALRHQLLRAAGLDGLGDGFLLSIAAREAESWVLGDRESFALFLGIDPKLIPVVPEDIIDPKLKVVEIGARSLKYRGELCPKKGSSAKVGVGYNEILTQFVLNHWHPEVAAVNSQSLRRTLNRLRAMRGKN
jgi:hypothetical protein